MKRTGEKKWSYSDRRRGYDMEQKIAAPDIAMLFAPQLS
jgi:hypothetical protein